MKQKQTSFFVQAHSFIFAARLGHISVKTGVNAFNFLFWTHFSQNRLCCFLLSILSIAYFNQNCFFFKFSILKKKYFKQVAGLERWQSGEFKTKLNFFLKLRKNIRFGGLIVLFNWLKAKVFQIYNWHGIQLLHKR